MNRYLPWVCFVLALCGGIFAGWVDFNNDEPQATVIVILSVTFVVGFIYPQRAWLWAVIVAVCLPGVYLFARSQGYQPTSPPSPGWYASLLSIIPALIGAYAGAFGRVIINQLWLKRDPEQK